MLQIAKIVYRWRIKIGIVRIDQSLKFIHQCPIAVPGIPDDKVKIICFYLDWLANIEIIEKISGGFKTKNFREFVGIQGINWKPAQSFHDIAFPGIVFTDKYIYAAGLDIKFLDWLIILNS